MAVITVLFILFCFFITYCHHIVTLLYHILMPHCYPVCIICTGTADVFFFQLSAIKQVFDISLTCLLVVLEVAVCCLGRIKNKIDWLISLSHVMSISLQPPSITTALVNFLLFISRPFFLLKYLKFILQKVIISLMSQHMTYPFAFPLP